MTQATPTAPRDTRPTVAGHPLPWKEMDWNDETKIMDADGEEVMAFGYDLSFPPDASVIKGLIDGVNRIVDLEAKLAREKQETSDLRKVIMDSLESDRQANKAMAKALRLQPGEQFLIPVAERLHDRIAALESALIEVIEVMLPETYERCGPFWNENKALEAKVKAILDRVGLAHRLEGNPDQAEQVTA